MNYVTLNNGIQMPLVGYGVSTDYLLAEIETKNHPNTELNALHLSDDMIALLCSGRLNNRLLCEMALHPGFPQLMTDIEICVNRIADMRMQTGPY